MPQHAFYGPSKTVAFWCPLRNGHLCESTASVTRNRRMKHEQFRPIICASELGCNPFIPSSSKALRLVFRPWPPRCRGFETIEFLPPTRTARVCVTVRHLAQDLFHTGGPTNSYAAVGTALQALPLCVNVTHIVQSTYKSCKTRPQDAT